MTKHNGKELGSSKEKQIKRREHDKKDQKRNRQKELHNMMNDRGMMRKVKTNLERKRNETERTKATKGKTTRERTGDGTRQDETNRDKVGKNEQQ